MAKQEKTNVMRILDQKKIPYEAHFYDSTEAISGMKVATTLGQNPKQVFKTLVTIGASKRNISSIFNAETFIIGLCSGLLGIGVTLAAVPIINNIIHSVTGNTDINAVLPMNAACVLVLLSVVLTLIGGLIPSSQAAHKDPVTALRSE